MKSFLKICLVLVLTGTQMQSFAAEKQDKAAKRAAILMQKMKQEMEAEKTALQSQFEQEKKGLSQALDQAQSAQRSHSAKLQGQLKRNQQLEVDNQKLQSDKAALTTQLAQLQTQLAEKTQQLEAAEQQLKVAHASQESSEQQRKQLLSKVSDSHQKLTSCEEKNSRLYAYGHELINLYDNASVYQKVLRSEPFFQLKRVELENILQEKHSQLLENKVDHLATP